MTVYTLMHACMHSNTDAHGHRVCTTRCVPAHSPHAAPRLCCACKHFTTTAWYASSGTFTFRASPAGSGLKEYDVALAFHQVLQICISCAYKSGRRDSAALLVVHCSPPNQEATHPKCKCMVHGRRQTDVNNTDGKKRLSRLGCSSCHGGINPSRPSAPVPSCLEGSYSSFALLPTCTVLAMSCEHRLAGRSAQRPRPHHHRRMSTHMPTLCVSA